MFRRAHILYFLNISLCSSNIYNYLFFSLITFWKKRTDGNYPPFLNGHGDLFLLGDLTFLHLPSIP